MHKIADIKKNLKRLTNIFEDVKYGYDQYSWVFFIGSIALILGGYFGLSGIGAMVVTVLFFYYIGKAHKKLVTSDGKKISAAGEFTASGNG